jgi:DNA-binding MarR family transcriptional regulator
MERSMTLTSDNLAIWRRFVDTTDQLRSRLATRLLAESELSGGDYAVLLALAEANGKRIRSSQLAAQIEWERSRLSHHLGRMEARGLVSRRKCAVDNRGAEVILTDRGAEEFRRASAPHLRAVQELFVDALTPALLDSLGEVVRALQHQLQGETDG